MIPSDGSVLSRGPTAADPSSARSLHHATVVTPEGVVLEFRAAGVGSRMLAIGIDLIIQFVAVVACAFLGVFLAAALGGTAGIVVTLLLIFVVFYGYSVALETWWRGQTIGKRVFGLRVMTTEGGPVAFRHAVIRSLVGTVDFWLPAPGGFIALTAALTTKNSQRLGDLAAGTIVVRDPDTGVAPVFFSPAPGVEALGFTIDASRMEPQHYALVREFLLRSGDLRPEYRVELAELLAAGLEAGAGAPRPPQLDAERYLISMMFAHQQRHRGLASRPPGTVR